jgi:lipopolysaccharide/colanic/teichoic acid biosynthesis glycosyltransferase
MAFSNSSRPAGDYLFSTGYNLFAIVITLFLAVELQSGSAGIYRFVRDDVITDIHRLAFVLGFPAAYVVSCLAVHFVIKMPRFDSLNRIIVINLIVYGFFGLILSASRINLFSRTVMLSGFIVSAILLMGFHFFRHRLYPRSLGILPDIDIEPFKSYPYLRVIKIDVGNPKNYKLNGLIVDLNRDHDEETSSFLSHLAQQQIPIYHSNGLIETLWGRIPLIELTADEIEAFVPHKFYTSIKRVVDIVLVLMLSPLLILFGLAIATAIKLDSSGPILFQQPRTGRYGTPFIVLKFRSMVVTEHTHDSRFAERNDKRVTPVGRLLRRLRLDELPQMWNVLRGEMSLIGPRPEQLEFTTRFDQLIPFYGFRHTLRPGITGWAQVMYGYAASDDQTRAKLEFDFFYIKHISLWLDFIIFVKTIRTIIIGSGVR